MEVHTGDKALNGATLGVAGSTKYLQPLAQARGLRLLEREA